MGAKTIDDLWKAADSICNPYAPHECHKYLVAAGHAFDQTIGAIEANLMTLSLNTKNWSPFFWGTLPARE
ncbi:hypothetical protein [Sphingomonas sp. 1185]|uniref:hypothetical protein n=1 Tax=Sphingomonas sp. 1185 TaxID=3156411 RepID=UPI003390C447